MPVSKHDPHGLKKLPSTYQKGGSKYQEGTVGGKKSEGTRYVKTPTKPVKIVESIDEMVDDAYDYKLAHPYQPNRVLKAGKK